MKLYSADCLIPLSSPINFVHISSSPSRVERSAQLRFKVHGSPVISAEFY